jgi:hypothetical protein
MAELETIFGLPINYTDAGNMSIAKRQHLGKAWSVHVLKHILRSLKLYFKCESTVSGKQRKWTAAQTSSLSLQMWGTKLIV